MRDYPITLVLIFTLMVAAVMISIQQPFAMYGGDNVFHTAKILAAQDGEYFKDPITGFKSIYPPLFHIVYGSVTGLFGLTGFQTQRLVQLINFIGLFLCCWFLFQTIVRNLEQSSLMALSLILLIYAPTGKYIFLQNPFNFSILFIVSGTAVFLKYVRHRKLTSIILASVLFGFGINIWWWNLFPVIGILAGSIVVCFFRGVIRRETKAITIFALTLLFVLSYNIWAFYNVAEILDLYSFTSSNQSEAASRTLFENFGIWLRTFLLKGNLQFFKHLFPEALDSNSRVVLAYALVASVQYYLLVLPFNFWMVAQSVRLSIKSFRDRTSDMLPVLLIGALLVFLFSITAMYMTDVSVVRRIQFFCFIFLLPGFAQFTFDRFNLRARLKLRLGMALSLMLITFFVCLYSFKVILNNPVSRDTSEVVDFLKSIPNHEETRIFMSEYDARILAREVRFRSFVLAGNPTYFRQDPVQADSIYSAYKSIVYQSPDSDRQLTMFETKFAIVGRSSTNISPVVGRDMENELSLVLTRFFDKRAELILENGEWKIYEFKIAKQDTL